MKPTPTPDVINKERIAERIIQSVCELQELPDLDHPETIVVNVDDLRAIIENNIDRAELALSVPAAAVVGEPVGYVSTPELVQLKMGVSCVDLFREPQPGGIDFAPVYAAPSAPDGWQPIETAPKDGTEILAYGYARCDGSRYANGQHIAWWDAELGWTGRDPDDRVTLHLSHWRPLPPRPELGGE